MGFFMRLLLVELERHFPLLTKLKQPLAETFGFEVEVAREIYAPAYGAFNAARSQWDGENLLRQLSSAFQHAPYSAVLAFFPYDLYAKGYRRAFGIAENNGKVAVVAYHYLDPALHGNPDEELFLRRLVKKSVHEIGHVIGLPHCTRPYCVMNFARTLLFLDRKQAAFCSKCRFLLGAQRPAESVD